jgi:hypothetical protein
MFLPSIKTLVSYIKTTAHSSINSTITLVQSIGMRSFAAVLVSAQILTLLTLSASLIQYKAINEPVAVEAAPANSISSSSSSQSDLIQPPIGTGLTSAPVGIKTTNATPPTSFKTKSGNEIKLKRFTVKNTDGTESTQVSAENPADQIILDKEAQDANPNGANGTVIVDESIKKTLGEKEIAEALAKTKEESTKNLANEDTKAFSTNSKGEKTELKEIGKDIATVDEKTKAVSDQIKSENTSKFVKEISEEESTTKGQIATKLDLDPDNQSKIDKNFQGTILDENLMSKSGLARKKKLLANAPKSSYKLNSYGSNYCEYGETYNTFCTHYYAGKWQGQFLAKNTNEGQVGGFYANWGQQQSPMYNVPSTNWGTKSVGNFWMESGDYEVAAHADDAIQVYVDGSQVIQNYNNPDFGYRSTVVRINSGWHNIQIDYYQGWGGAMRNFYMVKKQDNGNPYALMRNNNDTRVSGNNFVATADSWDTGSTQTGVNRVEFYAYYDGSWKYVGQEGNDLRDNIYSLSFNIPSNISSQTVYVQAKTYDNYGRWAWSPNMIPLSYYKRTAEKCNMPSNQWCGNYYNNLDWNFGNNPDGIIRYGGWSNADQTAQGYDFQHGYGSGVTDIRSDNFQSRTQGQFYFPRGYYKFNSNSDDNVRIYVTDAYYGYNNYGGVKNVLNVNCCSNVTSNEVFLEGNKYVVVDFQEGGGYARQNIQWYRSRLDDDKDPNGKINSVQWGINNNPRCFRVWAQAWDEGNSQSGVSYVNFFAGYSGGWKYLGYEFNDNVDNIYTQTHCLPDSIPSGANIELSIHIADKSGRYRYNGSEGNKWSTFSVVDRDNTAPSIGLTDFRTIGTPKGDAILLNASIADQTNGTAPKSGIKNIKYGIKLKSSRAVGYSSLASDNFDYYLDCIQFCDSTTPILNFCEKTNQCSRSEIIDYTFGIEATDNNGNVNTQKFEKTYTTPLARSIIYRELPSRENTMLDEFWQAIKERGARGDNLDSILNGIFWLALDLLILDDYRKCTDIADPHDQVKVYSYADRIIGCVFTILAVAGGVAKLAKSLQTVKAVKTVVVVGNDVDKARDLVKAVDTGEDAASALYFINKQGVYGKITPTTTNFVRNSTKIPATFEITAANGKKFWVNANATEHFGEQLAKNQLPTQLAKEKALLENFYQGLNNALENNLKTNGPRYADSFWEFEIKQRSADLINNIPADILPVIIHARPLK